MYVRGSIALLLLPALCLTFGGGGGDSMCNRKGVDERSVISPPTQSAALDIAEYTPRRFSAYDPCRVLVVLQGNNSEVQTELQRGARLVCFVGEITVRITTSEEGHEHNHISSSSTGEITTQQHTTMTTTPATS